MKGSKILLSAVFVCIIFVFGAAYAHSESTKPDKATAELYAATPEGKGKSVGTVTFTDTPAGLEINVNLHGLPPGEHGFHVHQNADCGPTKAADGTITPAGAAGGHYDPDNTGKHLGPNNGGHKGDLPLLVVGANGSVIETMKVLLKNVKAAEFKGHAVMIHAGGDNYSDTPVALGGGGGRIACGIIE